MNREELLDALEASRADLLDAIAGLSEAEMLEPGVEGDWSVKDILVHLSMWEGEVVMLMVGLEHGRKPSMESLRATDVDALNAKWHAATRDRPLDLALADYHGVRRQTLRRLQSLSEADLNDPHRRSWLQGTPVWEWIAEHTFRHEAEHAPEIRTWRLRAGV